MDRDQETIGILIDLIALLQRTIASQHEHNKSMMGLLNTALRSPKMDYKDFEIIETKMMESIAQRDTILQHVNSVVDPIMSIWHPKEPQP